MSGPTLVEKVLTIHDALEAAEVPHAFGGALALAYHVGDVRATKDIDLNIFASPEDAERVLALLPVGVEWDRSNIEAVRRDGQVRLWWEHTPVDLFFDVDDVHREAARHVRVVPFAGTAIPVLGSTELTVFKMIFSRPKDWVDISAMLEAGTVDPEAVGAAFARIMGPELEALGRLHELADAAPGRDAGVEPTFRSLIDRGADALDHPDAKE